MPKLIIFDLDGTLAESKQPLADEMSIPVGRLLEKTMVGITSGGRLDQLLHQFVAHLPRLANISNLYLLPTSGSALYEFREGEWKKVYEELLTTSEMEKIEEAMHAAAKETGLVNLTKKMWGPQIERRGSQVSISALGQRAPLVEKKAWDPDHVKRRTLQAAIGKRLPDFAAGIGGSTTIDVTKRGIDKAYGVHKLCEWVKVPEKETLYIGDELESGGNDEAVYRTDVQTKSVKGPSDTKRYIEQLLASA